MAYITDDDITDAVVKAFLLVGGELDAYHTETDAWFVEFAARKGVSSSSSIDVDDNGAVENFTIKRLLIAYFCMRVCEDKAGKNNVDISEAEKYVYKAEHFAKRVKDLSGLVTYSLITGTEAERADYVGTAYSMRG